MSEPEIDESERERRRELTQFLRARRAALSPPPASEPLRRRRRTPGLRREEVAERAGMSHVWYSWLERGRPIQVSPAMLERVAQALELNDDETAHLFTLVKRRAPRAESVETLPSAVVDILERHGNPACVFGARLDILAANEPFRRLYDHPEGEDEWQGNALWRAFTDPKKKTRHAGWLDYARNLTAMLRVSYAHHLGEPRFEALIERLKAASPEFVTIWAEQLVVRHLIRRVVICDDDDRRTTVEVVQLPMPWDPLQTIAFVNPLASDDPAG
jgi:transcriptional regulator with XRE-family HTH domain